MLPQCMTLGLQLRLVEAAVRSGRHGDAERITREGPVDDAASMLSTLAELPLGNFWPVINVAHRFKMTKEMVLFLRARDAWEYLAEYLCARGGAERFPQVLGVLAEVGEDGRIAQLAALVGGRAPVADTVAAAEGKQKLHLLRHWLEQVTAGGCQEPAALTALAQIYSDADPVRFVHFMQHNAARLSARAVGAYCAERHAQLALVAYAAGGCDDELLLLAARRGLAAELAQYLMQRSSADLWARALSSTECAPIRAELISAAVASALSASQSRARVAAALPALAQCDLGAEHAGALAELAARHGLYEVAFEVHRCAGDSVSAMHVLLQDCDCLVTAFDFATEAQSTAVWRMLGAAFLHKGMEDDARECFAAAGDHGAAAALLARCKGDSSVAACMEDGNADFEEALRGDGLQGCSATSSECREGDDKEVSDDEDSGQAQACAEEAEEEQEADDEEEVEGDEEDDDEDELEEDEEHENVSDGEVDRVVDDLPVELQRFALRPEAVQREGQPLAAGAYGVVQRGRVLGATIAIKEAKRRATGAQPGVPGPRSDRYQLTGDDELEDEMLALSQLQHPHVVRFIGVLCTRTPAIVTEYCPVGNLGRVLRRQALRASTGAPRAVLTWGLKAGWLRDVGLALRYMHHKGFLHRDVKSTNVLVDAKAPGSPPSEWVMKVADLGFACRADDPGLRDLLVGTRGFIAPEVLRDCAYSAASDVYSLGCLGVEMFCCRAPFAGAPSSVADRIAAGEANATMPAVVGGVPVPGRLSGILLCMLEADPQRRRGLALSIERITRDIEEDEAQYAAEAPAAALPDEAVQFGWPDVGPSRVRAKKRRAPWARWLRRKERRARRKRAAERRAARRAEASASSG